MPKKIVPEDPGALVIAPPNIRTIAVDIAGTAPLVQHRFSQKARAKILADQMKGSRKKSGNSREARDPEADLKEATHVSLEGWHGHPAPAFRAALISACRVAGFVMTRAKLSVFVEPDGFDADGTPLIRIEGTPERLDSTVRLESGVASVAIRPIFKQWSATPKITFDADQFSPQDVVNLLHRAGLQVGIGEGRPDSKKSSGQGWGTFTVGEFAEVSTK